MSYILSKICRRVQIREQQGELEGGKAHLKSNKPPSKSLDISTTFGAKLHFDNIKMLGGWSLSKKSVRDFFDKLHDKSLCGAQALS